MAGVNTGLIFVARLIVMGCLSIPVFAPAAFADTGVASAEREPAFTQSAVALEDAVANEDTVFIEDRVFLEGIVVDSDGVPLSGATIAPLGSGGVKSASDGTYRLSIAKGDHAWPLCVTLKGFAPSTLRDVIPYRDRRLEPWVLTRLVPFCGRVVDPLGEPIAGAKVDDTLTDEAGGYRVGVNPTRLEMNVRARGYLSRVVSVATVSAGEPVPDVILEPSADLELRLVGGARLLGRLSIPTLRFPNETRPTAIALLDGELALFEDLKPGRVEVEVLLRHRTHRATIELVAGQVTELNVEEGSPDLLTFLIRDEGGHSVSGAELSWSSPHTGGYCGNSQNFARVDSDENGRIEVEYRRGRLDQLSIRSKGYVRVVIDDIEARFAAGDLVVVDLVVGESIDVIVTDGGKPVSGWLSARGFVDKIKDGEFRLSELSDEPVELTFTPYSPVQWFENKLSCSVSSWVDLGTLDSHRVEWELPPLRRIPIQCFVDGEPYSSRSSGGQGLVIECSKERLHLDAEGRGTVLTRSSEDLTLRLGRFANSTWERNDVEEVFDTQIIPASHPVGIPLELHFRPGL